MSQSIFRKAFPENALSKRNVTIFDQIRQRVGNAER